MLATRWISPLGTCHSDPLMSRIRVVRRLMPSTTPMASPRSTTSPIPNWSSASMNMPDRKSRTRFCAPNPSARPSTPAPAIMGQGRPEGPQHGHDGDDPDDHGADRQDHCPQGIHTLSLARVDPDRGRRTPAAEAAHRDCPPWRARRAVDHPTDHHQHEAGNDRSPARCEGPAPPCGPLSRRSARSRSPRTASHRPCRDRNRGSSEAPTGPATCACHGPRRMRKRLWGPTVGSAGPPVPPSRTPDGTPSSGCLAVPDHVTRS
jgi:hypothetical protein